MDWFNNIFINSPDTVNNTDLQNAMKDGNITEEEYAIFADSDDTDVTESELNQIEQEFKEAVKFLATEAVDKAVEVAGQIVEAVGSVSQVVLKSTVDMLTNMLKPSNIRNEAKPQPDVNLNGDKNELLTELTTQEQFLEQNEQALSDVVNEQDPEIADAKDAKEKAWETFEEQNAEAANALSENQTAIGDVKKSISEKEKQISDKDGEINDAEMSLAQAENNKSTIEDSMSFLKSQLGSCGENEGDKKAYLNKLISQRETQLAYAEKKIQEAKDLIAKKEEEYNQLVEEKEELESGSNENSLNNLLAKRVELEEKYNLSEDESYQAFKQAEANFDTLKSTKLEEAKNNLSQSRANIQALEKQIVEVDNKELLKEESDYLNRILNSDNIDYSKAIDGSSGVGASNGVNRSSRGNRKIATQKEQEIETKQDAYDDAKTKYDEKETNLKNIYSGEDKDISAAKSNANKSFDSLQEALEKSGYSDLAGQIDTVKSNLDSKMAELDNINSQIMAQENALATANTNAAKNASMISTYEGVLAELQGTDTSNLTEEQKADLNTKIANIQKEIETAKTTTNDEISEANKAAQEKLEELKKQKTDLEGEVSDLNIELEGLLAQVPADCENKATDFKSAQQEYVDLKQTKETAAKDELKVARTEMNNADVDVSKLKDSENVKKFKFTTSDLPPEFAAKLDAKLGAGFTTRLSEIADKYGCSEQDLIGLMYSECALDPKRVNSNGGATGLIQFMPSTARSLGTTTNELAKMSAVEQLDYVDKYLGQYLKEGGNYSAGDLYTTVFLPAYLNRDILTTSGHKYYKWNKGLDVDKNGDISKADLTQRVKDKYEEALRCFK